jgi:hypothetical protein
MERMRGQQPHRRLPATRTWEEREFRKASTDWELARYFEII